MNRDNNIGRTLGLLTLAVAQIFAFTLLPAFDAVLEAQSYDVTTHLDAEGTDCPADHDELVCQLIRSLANGRPAPPTRLAVAVFPRAAMAGAPDAPVVTRAVRPGGSGPRAPPLT